MTVIFDLDDTLIASAPLWREAEEGLLRTLGETWNAELASRHKGMNCFDVTRVIWQHHRPDLPPAAGEQALRCRLIAAFERAPMRLMPGAEKLVRSLAGLCPLAVASGSPMEAITAALLRMGIRDCFDVTVSSESVARGKPAPDVFLEAAARLRVPPAACVVVEDSAAGAQAAVAAGMACLLVPSGPAQAEGCSAAHVFASLEAVTPGVIESLLRVKREAIA